MYLHLMDATEETTGNAVVVYRSEATGRVWVRPLSEWLGSVSEDGRDGTPKRIPRFERIEP